jgi:hypothetical protein
MANFMGAHRKETKTMETPIYGWIPRLQRTETTPTPHVLRCTKPETTAQWNATLQKLSQWMRTNHTQKELASRYNCRPKKDMTRPCTRTGHHRHINMARSQWNTTRAKQPRLELIHWRIPCRLVDLYATIIPDLHPEGNDREKMGQPLDHPAMGDSMGHVETSHENIGHARLTISHRPHDRAGSTNPSSLLLDFTTNLFPRCNDGVINHRTSSRSKQRTSNSSGSN